MGQSHNMNLVTRQTVADGAAARIRAKLDEDDKHKRPASIHWFGIWSKLIELGPSPDPDDVDELFGSKQSTWLFCSGCDQMVDMAVEVQEFEAEQVLLCRTCIMTAVKIIDATSPPVETTPL